MKRFTVIYKQGGYVYLDVDANTMEEAREIAEHADGGDFQEVKNSYIWELTEIIDNKKGDVVNKGVMVVI